MMKEGEGMVAPAKVPVTLRTDHVSLLAESARERAKFRGYRSGGQWAKGLTGGREYPGIGYLEGEERSAFVGFLGEWATAVWINSRLGGDVAVIDLKLRVTGDGGCDFMVRGLKIQVKTRQRADAPSLVRRATDRCAIVPVRADVYVFAEFLVTWTVNVLGWLWGWEVKKLEVTPARCAGHANSEVRDELLRPMSWLAAELRQRKDVSPWR